MDNLKIALTQMTSIDDVETNLNQMLSLLKTLSPDQVSAVFFPENCLYMRLQEGEKIQGLSLEHESFRILSEWAKTHRTGLHLGSVPILEKDILYNGSVWIDPSGKKQVSYRKIHLFDIQLESQKAIRESDIFKHGPQPEILNLEDWKIGQSICYDLRFSDLYHYYARQQVEAILIPSAFLVKTGLAHWEVLMRARAIESQCYVIASAQAGLHKSSRGQRETYGHSVVVDPWGQVLVELQDAPDIQIVELQKSQIQTVRKQIPMQHHRRGPF